MKFHVTYADGRALDVHAPTEADAREHARIVEAQRVEKVKSVGVDITAAVVAGAEKLKD